MTTLLKEIPKSELPRERLLQYGVENLSNEELLSIILRTGTKGKSVRDLSTLILSSCKNICDLKKLTVNKLKGIKGLGPVKAITLIAALELGKRVYDDIEYESKIKIKTSVEAYRHFAKYIEDEKQENLLAIYLDTQSQYLNHKIIFKGTINASIVHPREVFKTALLESASAIIIMHNHPSGDITPSKADDETTTSLAEVGSIMGIKLLDHLIIGNKDYYSYVEDGRLRYE